MNIIGVHHIGYLVKNAVASESAFKKLGYVTESRGYDPIQKSDIVFMRFEKTRVELVAPHVDSDVYSLLKRYKNTPYHICYEVEDLSAAMEELLPAGFMVFRSPARAVAISGNARVVFLMKRDLGIIELVER